MKSGRTRGTAEGDSARGRLNVENLRHGERQAMKDNEKRKVAKRRRHIERPGVTKYEKQRGEGPHRATRHGGA